MSGPLRRRIMASIVAFVLVWPIAQAALVARFRVDPWEFFAWSMYALPAARVQVRVDVERAGQIRPLRAMGEARRRIRAYARRRTALGALAPSDTLAQEVMATDPAIDAVVVVTRRITLDRATSRLVANDERHRFERAAAIGGAGA